MTRNTGLGQWASWQCEEDSDLCHATGHSGGLNLNGTFRVRSREDGGVLRVVVGTSD